MLWHYLLTMDDSVQLRHILERDVDSLASEYPTWPATIQQRQKLRQGQSKTEFVSEQVAHTDVNAVIPRHMVVAKTPRGNALKGLHARGLQQRWSPLYFAAATYVARWLVAHAPFAVPASECLTPGFQCRCDYPLVRLLLDHGAVPMRSERAPGGMHELHLSIQVCACYG